MMDRNIFLLLLSALLLGSCVGDPYSYYLLKIGTADKQGGHVRIYYEFKSMYGDSWSLAYPDYTKSGQWLVIQMGSLIANTETLDFVNFMPTSPTTGYPQGSPDGARVAYDYNGQLWYTMLGSLIHSRITNTDITEINPVFAYDDSLIYSALISDSIGYRIKICSLDGTSRRTISDKKARFRDGEFDLATRMFYYCDNTSSVNGRYPICRVSLDSGVTDTLTTVTGSNHWSSRSEGQWLFLRPEAGALFVNNAQSCLRIDLTTLGITTVLTYRASDVSTDGTELLYYERSEGSYKYPYQSHLFRCETDEHVFIGNGLQPRFVPNSERILMTYMGYVDIN